MDDMFPLSKRPFQNHFNIKLASYLVPVFDSVITVVKQIYGPNLRTHEKREKERKKSRGRALSASSR
jgi:hypothetical protein